MTEVKPETLALIVGYLVPGLIYTLVRLAVLGVKQPRHADYLLTYLVISLIYLGIYYPISLLPQVEAFNRDRPFAAWSIKVIGLPIALGYVFAISQPWLRRVMQFLGGTPLHHHPTAWDYAFNRKDPALLLITLKDGTQYQGFYGRMSHVSSDPNERDIYFEIIQPSLNNLTPNQRNLTPNQRNLTMGQRKFILLSRSEIKMIEFTSLP